MSISTNSGDVVVLDLGGTNLRLGHLRDGVPSTEFRKISSDLLRVDDAWHVLARLTQDYVSASALVPEAVVLGLPGVLDHAADTFSHCNNIPQLEGQGLQGFLQQALGCRVVLEQDIMLQLLGEWQSGVARGSDSVFGVYYGTGIGVAWLVDGNPRHKSMAGIQAGHIPIMAQGRRCVCGNTDCIEAYASGHRLLEIADEHGCPVDSLFLQNASPSLTSELEQFVLYQSFMIATLVTLFDPDMVVVGGGIPQMAAYPQKQLLANVREHLRKPDPSESVEIRWAAPGGSSALHGAIALLNA